jgi:hypothetical protein
MPTTMSYEEWMQHTGLGITSIRPEKLRTVDRALNEYNRIPTERNQSNLRNALFAWIADKGSMAMTSDARNSNNAVGDLFGQLVLGRRTLPFALRNDLLRVAQERVKGQIFGGNVQQTVVGPTGEITRKTIRKVGHLGESDVMLRIVAEQIERGLDCRISYGPVKTLESAARKVHDDYSGDWYQLKDAVRVTVIATNQGKLTGVRPEKLEAVKKKIEAVSVPSNGLTLIKNEEALPGAPGNRPKDNPCGYSVTVQLVEDTLSSDDTGSALRCDRMAVTR